jgi:inhibitor of cysteine peptidase
LNVIGSLRKIAPFQKIVSTRYFDRRLYLVTSIQIDPFFVIDLTNPKKLTILGQLKIDGFLNYLHPYDSTTTIGFGREIGDSG